MDLTRESRMDGRWADLTAIRSYFSFIDRADIRGIGILLLAVRLCYVTGESMSFGMPCVYIVLSFRVVQT